ncbi:class I adenylate-forming enzyme family protein [Oerskovia flava]|uniref:class I adenylate-forming enzyme family protein n=1 Tax=Oerskovia flava TaxID=2986422 RepID=UPI0022404112|nr:class I adenylate-forming enzyme family protein [Oerskovia sp. JB1-3-2]
MTGPDRSGEPSPAHLLTWILARGAPGHPDAGAVALRRWSRPRTGREPRLRDELTYGELARRVEATTAALRARGLAPGDRVLFSVRPRPEGVVLALAVLRARATVVFVDPGSTPELFAARVAAAAPTWAITEALLYAVSRGPLRRLARSRGLLLPDYAGLPLRHVHSGRRLPGVPRGAVSARTLARGARSAPTPDATLAPGEPGDEALVVFTSGTTSDPKAVVHSAGSLGAGCDLLRGVFAAQPGETVHTDQMLLGIPALLAGAVWSVPADPPARDVVAFAVQAGRSAGTYLVPADVTALLDAVESGRVPAAGPRVALVGGAPVTRTLLDRARRVLPRTRWVAVYGMTEILPVAVVEATEKLEHTGDGDLVGRPLPGVTARIDGPGPTGELVLGGPSLMTGYLADLTRRGRVPEGAIDEHRTGDLAQIDADGRILLVGRTRDMIIRGTVNIYPGLFEPRVAALPGVGEAVLVGVPRDDGDERVALVLTSDRTAAPIADDDGTSRPRAVVLTDDHPLVRDVRTRLADVLDHGALPDVVLHADHLPLGGRSRKPDRGALADAVRGSGLLDGVVR